MENISIENNVYTLTKTQLKNGKFQYSVIDQNDNVVLTRTSARQYVACTIYGTFFGRLDLIGKGEHGFKINLCHKNLSIPQSKYETFAMAKYQTYNQWIESNTNLLVRCTTIAYLK